MHEYLKLDLDFASLFYCKLDETFSMQPFIILALGQKTGVFCTELGLSVPLTYIPFKVRDNTALIKP